MAKDIKRKIVLEGEKEYSAALKEAQRNLKTLRSELKAETAELGANATAQQKNETRVKSLQKQIKEQEKIVKTYQAALAEVKEKYGDNEEAVAKWEQKLNEARASLATMRNTLEETNTSLHDMANGAKDATDGLQGAAKGAAETVVATKSVADALGDIADIGEGVSGAIEDIFTGMLGTVTDIAEKMWSLISETAERANGWTDTANVWGIDPQRVQQYTKALDSVGKDFSDLEGIVTKIVYGGKGKKITELLGISDVNYIGKGGEWDYAMAVMKKLSYLQGKGKNMSPIFEEIFGGKNATKAIDLVNSWESVLKGLQTFNGDESDYGLTSKEIEQMDKIWLDINRVETKFNDLKEQFAAGLGTAAGTLLVNVEGGLDAIAKFMNAETPEEREQALEDLRTNVEEFFRKVGEILGEGVKILGEVGEELQQSDDPVVHMIGDIFTALRDALQWMVDNQDKVKLAFEAVFGAWLLGKLGAVAGKLAEIITQIEVIKAFKGLELGAAGGAEAGAGGKLVSTALGGGSILGGLLSAGAGFLAGWPLYEKFKEVGWEGILNAMFPKEEIPGVPTGLVESYGQALSRTPEENKKALQSGLELLFGGGSDKQEEEETVTYGEPRRKKVITGIADESSMMGHIPDTAPGPTQAQRDAAEAFWDIFRQNFGDVPDSTFDDLEKAFQGNQDLFDKLDTLIDKLSEYDSVDDSWRNMEDLPANWWLDADKRQNSGNAVNGPTNGQKATAEAFWDAYRENGGYEDWQMDALESAFDGQEDMLEKLIYAIDNLSKGGWADQTWRDIEDLPESWWLDADSWRNAGNNNGGITSDDLASFRGLPAKVAAAAKLGTAEGISNIKVEIDGYTAGRLLAPYVSEFIAQDYTG